MAYIHATRQAGGTENTAIVMAAATGMLPQSGPSSLACNGGHILSGKDGATTIE